MSTLQALIIAILQGLPELCRVSSLGHAVLLPTLRGWSNDQHGPTCLPFLVVLHLGTAAALLRYLWRDWLGLALAFCGVGPLEERRAKWRLLWLIIVATIPAVILGFAFEKFLKGLFGSPTIAAAFLIVNGFLLFAGERLRRQSGARRLSEMNWRQALAIGLWQSTALVPGISRSGATMVGGLLLGVHHREAAHFSFLIATPIIIGAAVLEVPHLFRPDVAHAFSVTVWLPGALARITAHLSTAFLMPYFRRPDFEALHPLAHFLRAPRAPALGPPPRLG